MNIVPQRTGRVRLIAQRNDKNATGYNLVLEHEKDFLWWSYFIDDEETRNQYGLGYASLAEFYKAYEITFLPSMITLTDDKIREWVLGLDPDIGEFSILRIGKQREYENEIVL